VRHLIRVVASRGLLLDEGPSAGAPILRARIPVAHAQQQWERAVRAFGPTLPLVVAHKRPEDHISPLFFAAMSCRTIGEALEVIVQHWGYATDGCRAALIRTGCSTQLRLELQGPASLGARLGVEYLLADLVRSGYELSGGQWRPIGLVLGHRPPLSLERWSEACGVATRVDPGSPGVVMSEDSLALPVRAQIPPAVGRFFRELVAWLAPISPAEPTVTERVTTVLTDVLDAAAPAFPACEDVAQRLAMSTRSLRRQLAAENTCYAKLVDELRREEALRRIAHEASLIKAVACSLGFSDLRGFRRAFKRWTGLTPQQFRDRRRERR
jgi:AraC-like DNA-binding protein